jgi:hypothetical protein
MLLAHALLKGEAGIVNGLPKFASPRCVGCGYRVGPERNN